MNEVNKNLYRPCVGILLVHPNGKIFVGERIDAPGNWQMPQGGIEFGENPINAAKRELVEETGIKTVKYIATSRKIHKYDLPEKYRKISWDGRYLGQSQIWTAFHFLGTEKEINLVHSEPEFSNWKWTNPDQAISEVVDFKQAIYQEIFTEFSQIINLIKK
tara:strand:- start:43 stop:525 length:483 start_codon:yes stop_codon:yes gene_type:complete